MGKLKDRAKKIGKRFFNPYQWVSSESLGNTAKDIKETFKHFFVIQPRKEKGETFEEAKRRLKLSEKDLNSTARQFKWLARFFITCCLFVGGYMGYCFWQGNFLAGMMSLGIVCGLSGFAFKFHFRLFQIKQRKLGCTLEEWFHYGLLGKNNHKRLEK